MALSYGHGENVGPSASAMSQQSIGHQDQFYRSQEQVDDVPRLHHHARTESMQARQGSSPERGRTLRKKPDFPFNGMDIGLTPVGEDFRQSNITTMTDFINMDDAEASRTRSMSRHKSPPKAASAMSTEHKEKHRPSPLNLHEVRRYAAMVGAHINIHPVHNPITPRTAERLRFMDDGSSSVYSATPLAPTHDESAGDLSNIPYNPEAVDANVLQRYSDWRLDTPPVDVAANVEVLPKESPERRSTEGTANENELTVQEQKAKTTGLMPEPSSGVPASVPYTPLTPFIVGRDMGKTTKTLIGENGWLEDTAAKGVKKSESQKNTRFFESVKKTARKIVRVHCFPYLTRIETNTRQAEMTEFKATVAAFKSQPVKEIVISMDPREQSLLYCELGFILSNALSTFINAQLQSGRLNPHILAKVSDFWEQSGRPKVTGFRYDLETQVNLVNAHASIFRFHGPEHDNESHIKGLLYGMKMNARVMRITTYCQPDSVVAKHILDSQRFLQMLGTPEAMQVSLAEVSQFFRVAVEREEARRHNGDETGNSFVAEAMPAGTMNGKYKTAASKSLSSQEGYPGARRVKNQASLPESERQFSGPVLEPKTYGQAQSMRRKQVGSLRHPPGY
ncbi:hypothetical protein GGR52DRAFT_57611 [Hypoxylon sp. FL1284]|nr:hypothetical protein GGR52DRAFT_57611 [Hypoxylon sp. FL1284]